MQGRVKGFVGPRHFSSLGPFGDSRSTVGTVYPRLSGLMEGNARIIEKHGKSELYTPTVPLVRHRLRNVLFSYTSHFTGKLMVDFNS
jgi:hypothetical protein